MIFERTPVLARNSEFLPGKVERHKPQIPIPYRGMGGSKNNYFSVKAGGDGRSFDLQIYCAPTGGNYLQEILGAEGEPELVWLDSVAQQMHGCRRGEFA
jgi:hypothetical protein